MNTSHITISRLGNAITALRAVITCVNIIYNLKQTNDLVSAADQQKFMKTF